jgi:drug/metabolite transporter (DMT)-like permease
MVFLGEEIRLPSVRVTNPTSLTAQKLGYLFALGSAAAIGATYVFRKSVSETINPATFSVWWYGLAGVYAWILTFARRETHKAFAIRANWQWVLGLALSNAAGAILYYTEIDLTNPTLVSFFRRLRTIYVVLLGVVFFYERLNRQEWLGAAITISGAALIAYRGGTALNLVFLLSLVENLLMAISLIMAKVAVRAMPPTVLVAYRGVTIALFVLIYALATGQWQPVSGTTLSIIAIGALSGPFLGHIMSYASLARIDAGKSAIIGAVQPVFVTIYTVVLFGDLPTVQQAFGGALTIVGVILVIIAQNHPQPVLDTQRERN